MYYLLNKTIKRADPKLIKVYSGKFTSLVPSGASKGPYEAHESRDNDPTHYGGNGVLKAVHNAQNIIGPELLKRKFDVRRDLAKIDEFMVKLDGTGDKGGLGANAILGVSMACARAGAAGRVCFDIYVELYI